MTNAYNPVEDLRKVTSVQKKWRDAFATGNLDGRKWTSSTAPGGFGRGGECPGLPGAVTGDHE